MILSSTTTRRVRRTPRNAQPWCYRSATGPRKAFTLFVGVYWSERRESREAVAVRVARFLALVAQCEAIFARWFLKARTKSAGGIPVIPDANEVATKLKVNRRDVGGDVISELGFSLGLWNGRTASLSATVGACSPHVRNSVVLAFDERAQIDKQVLRKVLCAAIEAFEPDHGVVTSSKLLTSAGSVDPWETGWLTLRGHS